MLLAVDRTFPIDIAFAEILKGELAYWLQFPLSQ